MTWGLGKYYNASGINQLEPEAARLITLAKRSKSVETRRIAEEVYDLESNLKVITDPADATYDINLANRYARELRRRLKQEGLV